MCVMVTFSLKLNAESTGLLTGMTKNSPYLTSHFALLEAWRPSYLAGLSDAQHTSHHSFENASLWPPLFVHMALQFQPITSIHNLKSTSFMPLGKDTDY